jgi:hypothetical protein
MVAMDSSISVRDVVRLTYGINEVNLDVGGFSLQAVRWSVADILNVGPTTSAYRGSKRVLNHYVLRSGDHIEFMPEHGQKGSGDEFKSMLEAFASFTTRLDRIEILLNKLVAQKTEKEWYTTSELAEALGKSPFTITERYCNAGRIECRKDPDSGKWLIPGHEFKRLVNGGGLLPRRH